MTTLATWLLAQVDADEAVARAATPGPWEWRDEYELRLVAATTGFDVVSSPPQGTWNVEVDVDPADAAHIALHDPARVLADIAAKRGIVGLHGGDHECTSEADNCVYVMDHEACETLRHLAAVYADRPGYLAEWAPKGVAA